MATPVLQRGRPAFPLGDSLVVIHPQGERLCVLNPAARVIWEGWAEGLGADALAGRLAAWHIC